MTKEQRLQELKDQEQFHKVLDKYFDAGWREFVKGIRRSNVLSNERLYKVLVKVKGQQFVDDLRAFIKSVKHQHSRLNLTRSPIGMEFNDQRYASIPKIWFYQKSGSIYSPDGRTSSLCIQIDEKRWIIVNVQE